MVECEDGYSFTGQQTGQLSVTMTCGPGGIWSVDPVPVCESRCFNLQLFSRQFHILMTCRGKAIENIVRKRANAAFPMMSFSLPKKQITI